METFKLRQGDTIATLSEIEYQGAEGFQEDNAWHVAEETMTAESNVNLNDGPAVILHNGKEIPISVNILKFESSPGQEPESDGDEPACTIDISHAEGLTKLAITLGVE